MGLALYSPCAYQLIKQGFRRASSANHLSDTPSLSFTMQNSSFEQSLSRTTMNGDRRIRLTKKGSVVCCKNPSDKRASNPSKSNQEEIISLLKRIQSSISKGESQGVEEKEKENSDESSENKSLTKAVLDVLEKQRKKTEAVGDTDVQEQEPLKRQVKVHRLPSSFAKKTPIPSASGPRGKDTESNSNEDLGEMTEKEEKASLIETMKLAELKKVAKNRGIKGYSKLKKSQLLERLKTS